MNAFAHYALLYLIVSLMVYIVICNVSYLGARLERAFRRRGHYTVLELCFWLVLWIPFGILVLLLPLPND